MKRTGTIALFLIVCASAFAQTPKAAPVVQENVTVLSTPLIDADGYKYGVSYSLISTVKAAVCVFPYVVYQDNANGSVVTMIPLKAFEKNVGIGQFNSADTDKPWRVKVLAKWRKGDCADK